MQVQEHRPEDGPPLGQGARGEPEVREDGRRVHGHARADEAAVRRVVRRVPAARALRRARHAPDGRGRRDQVGRQVREGGQDDEIRGQEEVGASVARLISFSPAVLHTIGA